MAREDALWTWIKAGKPDNADLHRVENGVKRSMPDIEGYYLDGQFWIESKVLKAMTVKGDRGRIVFQLGQREWGARRWNLGGNSYCLIGVPPADSPNAIGAVHLIPGLFLTSLPLEGVVSVAALEERCILNFLMRRSGLYNDSPVKDSHTLRIMLDVLGSPSVARNVTLSLMLANPDLAKPILTEVDQLLQGIVDSAYDL